MWRTLKTYLNRLQLWRYNRRIQRALALNNRGECRRDGLRLGKVSNRLEVQWYARDIHPWDLGLAPEKRVGAFVEQSLADTEAAIGRIFDSMPQIDVLDLTVLEPESEKTLMAGTVERAAFTGNRRLLSIKMRLKSLGIHYRLAGSCFEPLDSDRRSTRLESSALRERAG